MEYKCPANMEGIIEANSCHGEGGIASCSNPDALCSSKSTESCEIKEISEKLEEIGVDSRCETDKLLNIEIEQGGKNELDPHEISPDSTCGINEAEVSPDSTRDVNKLDANQEDVNDENVKNSNGLPSTEEYRGLCGYKFDGDNVLRNENGEKFKFKVYDDHYLNQNRYEQIGQAIEGHVYELLVKDCKLKMHFIPFDPSDEEPQGFFFASENVTESEGKLLILIHGSGVVRAGQWARSVIINNNLMDGSQIPYIKKAFEENYEIIVLNTNQNHINGREIRGSETEVKHALYVWDEFIMKRTKAKHIAIMAHSYGGSVTVSLAQKRKNSFLTKVFAVGFSDSTHSSSDMDKEMKKFFQNHVVNWIASSDELDTPQPNNFFAFINFTTAMKRLSAGHPKHEWTSATCLPSVFKFFGEKFENVIKQRESDVDHGRANDEEDRGEESSDDDSDIETRTINKEQVLSGPENLEVVTSSGNVEGQSNEEVISCQTIRDGVEETKEVVSMEPHEEIGNVEPIREEVVNVEPIGEEVVNVEPIGEVVNVETTGEEVGNVEPIGEEVGNVEPIGEEVGNVEPIGE